MKMLKNQNFDEYKQSRVKQVSVLTKTQLQQVLVHLLTVRK